ncbi:hypothetical protein HX052_07565 [Myroides marinus]|uniref:hypothetical protein n=1 Tax=Myroides marinus TaxID=703342 RepID=UPI002578F696|nr:hypothetical protein [Myroides marinus]MDM1353810.1 hypothetical protein [Myroides marinus]MDM1361137.1 hypothetical protein [Myroides marinus]MDM1368158.1 hypothetical protein [Myroides marinus]MDM1372162.1 hypothetical protein [Myroides marinus]MDM1375091.1 hypothetical protein [Myroides marinus]
MSTENKKLAFTANAQGYIKTISSWGLFLAVLGFIGALFSLFSVFMSFKIGVVSGVLSLAVLVIQFISVLGLFSFSSKVKHALEGRDNASIDVAFKGMMTYFLFMLISFCVSFVSAFLQGV